jgi:hypothetical protein
VSFEVRPGEVFALLGVNGAGKTSALEVLEGLAPASGGSVRVLGADPRRERAAVRPHLGVLLQVSRLPGDLTVAETVRTWAGTLTAPRPVDEALAQVDLTGRAGHLERALEAGVRGFLPKTVSAPVLTEVVRTVHRGGRYVDPEPAAEAISAWDSPLTPREADVLGLAAGGAPVEERTCHRGPCATTCRPRRPSWARRTGTPRWGGGAAARLDLRRARSLPAFAGPGRESGRGRLSRARCPDAPSRRRAGRPRRW